MGVLNLNRRIQEKKQKKYEEDVLRLSKIIDTLLGDEGYQIVGLLKMTPSGIKPIVGIVEFNDAQKERYRLLKERMDKETLLK